KLQPKLNRTSNTTNESVEQLFKNIKATNASDSNSVGFFSMNSGCPQSKVPQSPCGSNKAIKILNVPKIPPLPPSLIKSPNYLDSCHSDQSKPSPISPIQVASVVPPLPPPLPLPTDFDIKITSGEENDSHQLPNNFLKDSDQAKKIEEKLNHNLNNNEIKKFNEEDSDQAKKIEEKLNQNLNNNEIKKFNEENNFIKVNDVLSKTSSASTHSLTKSTSSVTKKQSGFKIVSIDNVQLNAEKERQKSDSIISYGNTSSESSSSDEDNKINEFITQSKLADITQELDDSQNLDHFATPMSTINSSRTLSEHSVNAKASSDNETIKMESEDFTLNIFSQSFEQKNDHKLPLVYNCRPLERDARLKNVLIKLHFDLEKYNAQTNSKELDILVRNPDESQPDDGLASFRRTVSHPGNLIESPSSNTIVSREAFFDSLRQLVEESQDETDTEYQRSFQNLNEFYNSLLRKFQNKFHYRNDSFDVVSSALSDGETDPVDNQMSDSSVVHSDMNEFSDLYKTEQNKLKNQRRSSFIAVIDEASEESSSDTVFRPSKKFDNEGLEKINTEERSVSRSSRVLRSKADQQMSTDSDDTFLKPSERKTPTKHFKKRQNSDLNKVHAEEEAKFRTNSSLEVRNEIWDRIENLESEIGRAKSVPAEKMKKEDRERPKSVAFVENEKDEKPSVSNLIKIWSQAKKVCEEHKDKSFAGVWSEINQEEREREAKRLEELKNSVERSNLFIIWKEARNVSKQRSKMSAYEQVSKEQRAHKMDKVFEQDLSKSSQESIDEKVSSKNSPLPLIPAKKYSSSSHSSRLDSLPKDSKIPEPPPLPNWKQSSSESDESISKQISAKLVPLPMPPGKKSDSSSDNISLNKQTNVRKSSIPILGKKFGLKKSDSSELSEEYIDVRLTPPIPESKYPTIENLIKKFEVRDDGVVSTSNSEKSSRLPTRAAGIIANKERKNQSQDSRKSFSEQANSLLLNVKKSQPKQIQSEYLADEKFESQPKNLFNKNENYKAKNFRLKSNELEDSKPLLSETIQKDEFGNSILKRQTSESNSSGAGIHLSDETSDTSSDIGKYFVLKNDQEKPNIPPKLSTEDSNRQKIEMVKSDSESSSDDYAIPRNISLFNLETNQADKEKVPNFLSEESEQIRDSSLLDKILLKPSKIDESQNVEENLVETNKHASEFDSPQSDYDSEAENLRDSNEGPSVETLEIIKRLREIPSQSASPEMLGMRTINSELTRETKLSGGKQRKPNEESFDRNLKRTKSSNSVNLNLRNNFFTKLFARDKASKSSSGSNLKKKKKTFNK
ncbi:hypothetical protein BpHYR1_010354, partial [Brachionus plicatilis]